MNIDYVLLSHGINASKNIKVAPDPITNFEITAGDSKLTLKWTNPISSNFHGVRIQRKIGSYPTVVTDGTTVYNGVANTYTDTNLTNGVVYYYRAFTYDSNNLFNTNESQQISGIPKEVKNYTVIIDLANSNPSTSVTYADDAVSMTAASSAWDNVFPYRDIKPVMFLNGKVNYNLNPSNFAQKQNGSAADITSGNDGDVMIQIPKVWTYIRKIGNKVHVSMATDKIDENYKCLGHTKGGVEKDFFYVGAYQAHFLSSKLRSLSGKAIDHDFTLAYYRNGVQQNGEGYRILSYYQVLIIQVLYLIKYKNLNSQNTIGAGSLHGWQNYNEKTGALNQSGMTVINTSNDTQMKLFGMEDIWAGHTDLIDGILVDPNMNILIGDDGFNNEGTGYKNVGKFTGALDGYINNVMGGNETAFIPTLAGASETTYFCDMIVVNQSATYRRCEFGGLAEYYRGCGIFSMEFTLDVDTSGWGSACRLCYL